MKQCPNCGQAVGGGDVFCVACGTPAASVSPLPEPLPELAPAKAPFRAEAPPARDERPRRTRLSATRNPEKTYSFRNTGLGLILLSGLLAAVFGAGLLIPGFTALQNIKDLTGRFGVYALAALAVALTARAKGPDLSIGAVIGVSSVIGALVPALGGSVPLAICLAVLVSAAFGLVNGALTAYLKLPAVILTLLTGFIARGTGALLTNGQAIPAPQYAALFVPPALLLALLGAALVAAFLLVLLSGLGTPTYKREGASGRACVMLAYAGSAVFAATAGILMLIGAQSSGMTAGADYELFVVFVFAVLVSSRALDNRVAPALFCLAPALIWTVGGGVLKFLNVGAYPAAIISGGLALAALVLAYVCRYEKCPGIGRQSALPL